MIDLSTYRGRTLAVMGLGKSGLSAARALQEGGASVRAWDDSEARREDASNAGLPVRDLAAEPWDDIDALVLSPGIPHTHPAPHPAAQKARESGRPIIGDIALLSRAQPAARYIGITGTNGKSTTTALIGHLFKSAGWTVEVGGNLGVPALDLAPLEDGGAYVLEMSSYQLELTPPIPFDVAVLLNISPDHLDRHGGMEGYVAAKKLIFQNQTAEHTALVGADDDICRDIADGLERDGVQTLRRVSGDHRVSGGAYAVDGFLYDDMDGQNTPLIRIGDIPTLPGAHNAQNASAAFAAAHSAGIASDAICDAMRSFPGLAHRQEPVAEIDGIRYVNDSKATNPEAAAKALSSYDRIYWIAGGLAKEGGLDAVLPYLGRVRHVFLIGEAAESFAQALGSQVETSLSGSLEAATQAAHEHARRAGRPGAVILLAPACASFDQFPNFEARGSAFRRLVEALPGGARRIFSDGESA